MLLGEMLVVRGLATPTEIETALERQQREGGRLGAHLIAMGVLTSEELFRLLEQQEQVRVTLPFCERTLERWEAEFGALHPSTGRVRCNLARVLLADGRASDALAMSQAAHEMHLQLLGREHPWTRKSAEILEACQAAVHQPGTAALARLRAETLSGK